MPRGTRAGGSTTEPERIDDPTRDRILQSALECFAQLGILKTSVQDVARQARVSRGTVYRYFSERQDLIDAAIELRDQLYYEDAAKKLDARDTFVAQIGVLGEMVGKSVGTYSRRPLRDDESMVMRLSARDRDAALRRMSAFLVPYVDAARRRGEVRPDLDPAGAAEWLARMLMSVAAMESSSVFDVRRPKSVGEFMVTYGVAGLQAPR